MKVGGATVLLIKFTSPKVFCRLLVFKVTLSLHKTVKNSHFLQEDKTLTARISAFAI